MECKFELENPFNHYPDEEKRPRSRAIGETQVHWLTRKQEPKSLSGFYSGDSS
jgi:hypothetical protein